MKTFKLQVAPSQPLVLVGSSLKEFNASTLEEVLEQVRKQLGLTAWVVEISRAGPIATRGKVIKTMGELKRAAPFKDGAHQGKIQVWLVGLDPTITKPDTLSAEIFEQLVATAPSAGIDLTPGFLSHLTEEEANFVIQNYKGGGRGPEPNVGGGYRDPPKRKKRKNTMRKSNKRKNTKRKKRRDTRRKNTKRNKRKKKKNTKKR